MLSTASMPLSDKKPAKTVRDSNIELLRIFSMLGVVLLHYNGYVGQALQAVLSDSINHWILLYGEGLFICAVNLFILISGYFSCTSQRRQPVKIFSLILQVMVFNCADYLCRAFSSQSFTWVDFLWALIPANYFVILYAALYVISPYINLAMQQLSRKQLDKLLITALLLFSVFPLLADLAEFFWDTSIIGINPVSAYGDDFGYTFVNFALMYVIGAYIRLADVQIKKRYTGIAVIVFASVLAITGKYDTSGGLAWSYCNPLVIAEAVAIFLLFRQIRLRSRIINELSKGAFTCFLFHHYLLAKFQIAQAVQRSPGYLIVHILFVCISIYLVSWVVYKAYDLIFGSIVRLLSRCLKKRNSKSYTDA